MEGACLKQIGNKKFDCLNDGYTEFLELKKQYSQEELDRYNRFWLQRSDLVEKDLEVNSLSGEVRNKTTKTPIGLLASDCMVKYSKKFRRGIIIE